MLVESACELDDNLINKYLEGEELTTEELVGAVRQGVREQKLFPVLATAGTRSIGLDPLLNAIVQLLPSPAEVEVKVSDGETLDVNDKLAALVFKTVVRSQHRTAELCARVFGHADGRQSRVEQPERQG